MTKRNDIIEVGRELLETKLVARTWGNISSREDDDNFLITPSGLDYITMTEDDIVSVNIATGEWNSKNRPSGERGVHKAAYEVFSDVNFVVHTHQTFATAIGLAGFDALDITKEEIEKLGGIATAEYGLPGTDKLTNAVKNALESGAHTILMIHHGVLVLGKDRREAMERTKLLEEICERNIKGKITDKKVSEKDIKMLENMIGLAQSVKIVSTPELIEVSNKEKTIVSQLDDVSQMIGTEVNCVDVEFAMKALENTNAILVRGVGALVKSDDQDDIEALFVLMQKMAVVKLHTSAYGVEAIISREESDFMHYDYINRYSKQKNKG